MIKKKKIFFLLMLLTVLVIFTLGIIRFLFSTPILENNLISIFLEKNKIVYFGDSVLNADFNNTEHPSSLVNILQNKIKLDILEISGAGYNPFIYKNYLETIKKYNNHTKLVIIPINLRAFSSSWIDLPALQFEQECSFLSLINLTVDFLCINEHLKNLLFKKRVEEKHKKFLLEPINSKNAKGFLNETKRNFFTASRCESDIEKGVICKNKNDYDQYIDYMQHGVTLREAMQIMRYNYHYSENIENNNISLKYIKDIVEISKNSSLKILFYVTPIDIERITFYSGEILLNIINNNLNTLYKNISGNNIYKVNLINILKREHFEEECACEHINKEGKRILSDHLIKFINTKIGNI